MVPSGLMVSMSQGMVSTSQGALGLMVMVAFSVAWVRLTGPNLMSVFWSARAGELPALSNAAEATTRTAAAPAARRRSERG